MTYTLSRVHPQTHPSLTFYVRRLSPLGRIDWTGPWTFNEAITQRAQWLRVGYEARVHRASSAVLDLVAEWEHTNRVERRSDLETPRSTA